MTNFERIKAMNEKEFAQFVVYDAKEIYLGYTDSALGFEQWLSQEAVTIKTCGQCSHFLGGGDWGLCCDIKHPTPKEKEQGLDFYFGYLCYEDTEACDMFEEGEDGE